LLSRETIGSNSQCKSNKIFGQVSTYTVKPKQNRREGMGKGGEVVGGDTFLLHFETGLWIMVGRKMAKGSSPDV
jgi:hypothetical protein